MVAVIEDGVVGVSTSGKIVVAMLTGFVVVLSRVGTSATVDVANIAEAIVTSVNKLLDPEPVVVLGITDRVVVTAAVLRAAAVGTADDVAT